MSRDQFARVLAWTLDDQDWAIHGCGPRDYGGRCMPASWPEIMLAQRLAWHHGPAEAYQRVFGDGRKVAA